MIPANFLEFATEDDAECFLKDVPKSMKFEEGDIKIKRAITKISSKRNWALRRASELISQASESKNRTIKTENRTITVDGVAAFIQEQNDLIGHFCSPYLALHIP